MKLLLITAAALLTFRSAAAAEAPTVSYKTVDVDGQHIFYREAGRADAPALLLLHGRQTSSHMFRELIPLLAGRFHVIAPDLPGFGQSSAPPPSEFAYTFDHLAEVTGHLAKSLNLHRFGLVMHDWGVQIGFRIASSAPNQVSLLVVQNGVICDDPKRERVWLDPYWEKRDAAAETRLRNSYRLQTTVKYHQVGAASPARVSPDAWVLDQYYLDLPGRQDIQAELMFDFGKDRVHYGQWHDYLAKERPPLLVLWGKNSPVYSDYHPTCFTGADPAATIHYYEGGHFLLDEYAADAADRIMALAQLR